MRKDIKRPDPLINEEKLVLLSGDQLLKEDDLSAYTGKPRRAFRRYRKRRLSSYKFELIRDRIDLKTVKTVQSSSENAGSHSLSELCNFQSQNRE